MLQPPEPGYPTQAVKGFDDIEKAAIAQFLDKNVPVEEVTRWVNTTTYLKLALGFICFTCDVAVVAQIPSGIAEDNPFVEQFRSVLFGKC